MASLKRKLSSYKFFKLENEFIVFIIFFAFSILSYYYSFFNSFLGDDVGRVARNYALAGNFSNAITAALADRPMLMFSLWLEVKIFGEPNPTHLRMVNLLIHSFVGIFMYKIGKTICKDVNQNSTKSLVLIILLFLLHPIHNQVINIIIQRGVLLAALFMLISFYMYLKFIQTKVMKEYLLSILFFILSVCSKGITIVFPLILLAWNSTQKISKNRIKLIIPYIFVSCIPVFFYTILQINRQDEAASIWQYFLIQTRVIFIYLKLYLLPFGLKYLYAFTPTNNILLHYSWLAMIGHAVLFYFIYKLFNKNKISFWLLLSTYILFIPESSFFPIAHYAFEHRTYLPFIFLTLGLFSIFHHNLIKINLNKILLCSIIPFYIALNWHRNDQIFPPYKWVIHSIESGSNDHYYNLGWGTSLFFIGKNHDAQRIFTSLAKKFPQINDYDKLASLFNILLLEKSKRKKQLISFGALLAKNNDISLYSRNRILIIIIKELKELIKDDSESKKTIEKLLSNQVSYLIEDASASSQLLKTHFDLLIYFKKKYSLLNKKIMYEQEEHYLNTRFILNYFFELEDKKLYSDLNTFLIKYPANNKLLLARERLKNKKK